VSCCNGGSDASRGGAVADANPPPAQVDGGSFRDARATDLEPSHSFRRDVCSVHELFMRGAPVSRPLHQEAVNHVEVVSAEPGSMTRV
jgi:hypothetical protein